MLDSIRSTAFLILGIKFFEHSKLLSEGPCTFSVLTTIWLFQNSRKGALLPFIKAESIKILQRLTAQKREMLMRLKSQTPAGWLTFQFLLKAQAIPFLNKVIHSPGACFGIHVPASVYLGNRSSLNINEGILHHPIWKMHIATQTHKGKPNSDQSGVGSSRVKACDNHCEFWR